MNFSTLKRKHELDSLKMKQNFGTFCQSFAFKSWQTSIEACNRHFNWNITPTIACQCPSNCAAFFDTATLFQHFN